MKNRRSAQRATERWRPRRLARLRPRCRTGNPSNFAGNRRRRKPPIRRRDAAEPAGGTPALRRRTPARKRL